MSIDAVTAEAAAMMMNGTPAAEMAAPTATPSSFPTNPGPAEAVLADFRRQLGELKASVDMHEKVITALVKRMALTTLVPQLQAQAEQQISAALDQEGGLASVAAGLM